MTLMWLFHLLIKLTNQPVNFLLYSLGSFCIFQKGWIKKNIYDTSIFNLATFRSSFIRAFFTRLLVWLFYFDISLYSTYDSMWFILFLVFRKCGVVNPPRIGSQHTMDTPSMDTIYQAISALYDNPNANEKEKASKWLGEIQKSVSNFLKQEYHNLDPESIYKNCAWYWR